MQRLTGLDATFLYLETPANHMHVGSLAIFDPSTVPEGYEYEKVVDLVRDRLPLLPPFRRRLKEIPFQLNHPVWVEDPGFDIHNHMRRMAVPAPGGMAEIAELAADFMGRQLDRNKPLWEMWVVEGLEDGNIAVLTKTHHAAIDGVSGAELTVNLLDLQPEPAPSPPDEWKPDRVPSDFELVGFALASLARQPVRAAKTARRTAEALWGLRQRNRHPDVSPPPAPFSAPRTSINTSITARRSLGYLQVDLEEVKRIKGALGGTVNDVVLAACGRGLRNYFEAKGETLDGPLVAMVPISVRGEDEQGAMGNKVGAMMVSLADDRKECVDQLRAISDGTKHAKDQEKAIDAATLASDWTEFAAPSVAALAARLASRTRVFDRVRPMFNVTISNVPGPPFPLYSAGARMTAMYPMGPITDGTGLNITVMSYMGQMFFGLLACKDTIPDVERIVDGLDEALKELSKAADEATATKPERAPRATNGGANKAPAKAAAKAPAKSKPKPKRPAARTASRTT